MNRILVKPKPGRVVWLPDGSGRLPEAGKTVTRNGYWTRRERDGDIDVSEPPAQTQPAAKAAAPQAARAASKKAVTSATPQPPDPDNG
ncbi:DUF2635 domain-containing protein [Paraburkholderia adhaesiva]|uniref:DUF2635 domain-containing protein n=1 Tax=Paraburkholderia adhaesiva TaxID=2883244 RepID=UPI001F2F0527|nr:DUF2635 domain-containing protein [Paraburkholderia adhaesiva]